MIAENKQESSERKRLTCEKAEIEGKSLEPQLAESQSSVLLVWSVSAMPLDPT